MRPFGIALCTVLAELVLAEVALEDAACEDTQVCLLQLRGAKTAPARAPEVFLSQLSSQLATRSSEAVLRDLRQRHEELSEWKLATRKIRQQLHDSHRLAHRRNPARDVLSKGDMDTFVSSQKSSDDACHAKQLEAKRTLDGILDQVDKLTDETEANNEVIEANTGVLADVVEKRKLDEETKKEESGTCEKNAAQRAEEEHSQVNAELEELQQIANPEVRSKVAMKESYGQALKDVAAEIRRDGAASNSTTAPLGSAPPASTSPTLAPSSSLALVSSRTWYQTHCKQLARSLSKLLLISSGRVSQEPSSDTSRSKNPKAPAESECDEAREELQEEFSEAFVKLGELYDKKDKEINEEKEVCKDVVTDRFREEEVVHEENIAKASDSISTAKKDLEELEPLIGDAKHSAERMREHIVDLKETCQVDEEVTVYVEKVRDLIEKLEECPGRNDFWLKVPELPEHPKELAVGSAAPSASGVARPNFGVSPAVTQPAK